MHSTVSRRSIFAGALAVGTLATTQALAAGKKSAAGSMHMDHGSMDHGNMDHGNMGNMKQGGGTFELTRDEERVVKALSACKAAGEVCLSQCIESLSGGDTSMAACARAVRTMLAVCDAAQKLVQNHSTFAGQQLALCRDACSACETECVKHKSHHAACRSCAEACKDAMSAIDRLLG